MFKELTIAIILGSIVGFGATFGYINIKNQSTTKTDQPTDQQISPLTDQDSNLPTPTVHTLSLIEPDNQSVVNQAKITIKGQTTPLSNLIIHTTTDTIFLQINQDGLFQQEIELEGGANLIQVSSLSPSEEQIDKEILITFSTVDF